MNQPTSLEQEKSSRRRHCILQAVQTILNEQDYHKLTIEQVASRAGVGKSTIYRWWSHKSDLVFELFRDETETIFDLDFRHSLERNLEQQLLKLAEVLDQPIGRALLAVIAENRDKAGQFFKEYLLPRRVETRKLIQLAIERQEIRADYPFELFLDSLYAPIHYQIIFFNQRPDAEYIRALIQLMLALIRLSNPNGAQSCS